MTDATPIYENPRAWRVRIAQGAIWGVGVVLLWLALSAAGEGAAKGDRVLAWGAALAAVAAMALTEAFLRAYVVRIAGDRTAWRVTTLRGFGKETTEVDPRDALLGATRHDSATVPVTVDNSWATLRIAGRRIPLVLDLTPPARLDVGRVRSVRRAATR